MEISVTYNGIYASILAMQLRFTDHGSFISIQKPYGLRTHAVSEGQIGFVETISEKMKQDLFVVHRLDKETSGLIIFAKTKEAAKNLSLLFEQKNIQKDYLFLTDKKTSETEYTMKSFIDKVGSNYISTTGKTFNSETYFKQLQYFPKRNLYLWQAQPITGKPHQIRLHAQDLKMPILGDKEHGGSPFFRLALHAQKIQFELDNQKYNLESKTPPLFNSLHEDEFFLLLEENLLLRKELYNISSSESYRLIHLENSEIRTDIFSDRLWIYDYTEEGLSDSKKSILKKFCEKYNFQLIIRHMLDRGKGIGGKEVSTLTSTDSNSWIAEEEGVSYLLKTNSGFSPGLFLDQRENRAWVKQSSRDKKVLNLFSYTSGFSVNAALGAANEVTSVDVSRNFLEWSKENFKLNNLIPEDYEFFAQDCLLFLKGAQKRNRKWDLIICDPPSFGRSKEGLWRLEKDLPHLAELMFQCLDASGKVLFTCNYEGWNQPELIRQFTKNLKGRNFKVKRLPYLSLDYELTDSQTNLMKGFILELDS